MRAATLTRPLTLALALALALARARALGLSPHPTSTPTPTPSPTPNPNPTPNQVDVRALAPELLGRGLLVIVGGLLVRIVVTRLALVTPTLTSTLPLALIPKPQP